MSLAGVPEALGIATLGPDLLCECLTEAADIWGKHYSSGFNGKWLIYVLSEIYKIQKYKSVARRIKRLHIFPSRNKKLMSLEDDCGKETTIFQVRSSGKSTHNPLMSLRGCFYEIC